MATASLGQWYNGISDDDYIGNPGTFAYSTDINVHKNPKALVLSAAPTNRLSLQSTDGSPNVVVNLSESGGNCTGTLVGTTQGKIYKD